MEDASQDVRRASIRAPIVFISYARADAAPVDRIVEALRRVGCEIWIDRHNLLPGQDYRMIIEQAIRECDNFILCLSRNSVNKEGMIQVEIKTALEKYKEKFENSTFLLPVRIDDCPIPLSLEKYQCEDLREEGGWERVLAAVQKRMKELEISFQPVLYSSKEVEKFDRYTNADVARKARRWLAYQRIFTGFAVALCLVTLVAVYSAYNDRSLINSLSRMLTAEDPVVYEDRAGFVKNDDFKSGGDYWNLSGAPQGIGASAIFDQRGAVFALAPGDSLVFGQTGVKFPEFFGRDVVLSIAGTVRREAGQVALSTLIRKADGETVLPTEPHLLGPGAFSKKVNITHLAGQIIGLAVSFHHATRPAEIALHKVAIASHITPRTLIVSLRRQQDYFQNRPKSDWSDFFDVFRHRPDGNPDTVWINRRFSSQGYTLVENLEPGHYRVVARFFGIAYDVLDSVYVGLEKGNHAELFASGNQGPMQVRVETETGAPIANARLKLFTQDGMLVYFPASATDRQGLIPEDLWVWPPGRPGEYYAVEVYVGDELVATKTGIRPAFPFPNKTWVEHVVVR